MSQSSSCTAIYQILMKNFDTERERERENCLEFETGNGAAGFNSTSGGTNFRRRFKQEKNKRK